MCRPLSVCSKKVGSERAWAWRPREGGGQEQEQEGRLVVDRPVLLSVVCYDLFGEGLGCLIEESHTGRLDSLRDSAQAL